LISDKKKCYNSGKILYGSINKILKSPWYEKHYIKGLAKKSPILLTKI